MDIASLLGIVSGISLIVSAIFLGGDIHNFINVPGLMIVGGGTVATTLLTFQFRDVLAAFKAAYFVFSKQKEDPNEAVATMIKLCHISRRQGILELSKVKTRSGFLKKACGLIADGSTNDVIRDALTTEIESLKMRHFIVQDVFRKMGTYSPAFGMLGTLIGLVQMLSKLQDPSNIGPAMATALLTTFYGSLMSTLFFLPVAGKLKARTVMEVINLEIMLEGSISILDNNNPVILYEKLSSFISARLRIPLSKMDVRR
ncbi:MAG: MotA/TolQ/ExbB proton channel family protein [Desulfobacterium sp.]|nr:MotA/TolQ/ExbB proton channel family protein [Desulfobacterium sp.]